MKLSKWLKTNKMTAKQFGKKIGVSRSQVHKYAYEGAIPRHQVMTRIFEVTQKEVTPNDFFNITLEITITTPLKLKLERQYDENK